MAEFIKLTQITNWKIDKDKKEPTATKTVYVRPCDIASFEEDDGTTLVQFMDKGIHVKETPSEIYEKISGYEFKPLKPIVEKKHHKHNDIFTDDDFWWSKPFKAEWTNRDTFEKLNSNTPYYGYAIIFGNGEIWE